MFLLKNLASLPPLRAAINAHYRMDEHQCVDKLLQYIQLSDEDTQSIHDQAYKLVEEIRKSKESQNGLDAFLHKYDLSSEEGIALMCLAEALLRIPDKETVDRLIRDKISSADWEGHLKKGDPLFVNAATWALMLTGKILAPEKDKPRHFKFALKRLVSRSGEPVIRKAVAHAMRILGRQFVMGETIDAALKRAQESEEKGYLYSYDMLGEAARTAKDAERFYLAYENAIKAIGKAAKGKGPHHGPGISIKLSALHPRYEFAQRDRVIEEVTPKVLSLILLAKEMGIGVTIDAEEADRLDLSLDIFERIFVAPELEDWEGLGLAVQAYQKRAFPVLDLLIELSRRAQRRIMVRLVKGAYWDTEIKLAQVNGLEGYPVFTRKASTDVSYLACAKKMLEAPDVFYPQFATHNAWHVAAILHLAGEHHTDYEFQCLHGMGQSLYDFIVGPNYANRPCRIYAPVGGHEDLLAYLVRRLLENGANTSFVNRIVDGQSPIEEVIRNPLQYVAELPSKPHPRIPLASQIYCGDRINSAGIDISDLEVTAQLAKQMRPFYDKNWSVEPLVNHPIKWEQRQPVYSPTDRGYRVGDVVETPKEAAGTAIQAALIAQPTWEATSVETRAACLEKMGNLLEQNMAEFMAIAVREAGKTIPDAIAEVREAVDFCRYYAARAREIMATPTVLTSPTGELDQLSFRGRGLIVCISPWNFPLAIFIGQVAAALVTGNAVLAKPAEQTPIIAARAVALFYEAGIPKPILQYLPGQGEVIGAALVGDPRIAGVMFTGSTQTARLINQTLANREGAIIPLIAETGGQNAMIVDSSALPEQAVRDVVQSAFGSAGQRCSALRVLFIQTDIADKFITMLKGAMAELRVGDPALLCTDVGPVIDEEAQAILLKHIGKMKRMGKLIHQVSLPESTQSGCFCPPTAFEIDSITQLESEVFGPVLHVVRFRNHELDDVINNINNTGYGLTLGIHSRVNETVHHIVSRAKVGNIYVNRNMVGAVVGVQPFGGEGLSGTGPKAGGPNYLQRLCTEHTLSIDTTAAGGNASLVSLQEN